MRGWAKAVAFGVALSAETDANPLSLGDTIKVGGRIHTVADGNTLVNGTVLLSAPYTGETRGSVSVFKRVKSSLRKISNLEGGDIFFSELWTSPLLDGSHAWYSDGGVSTYNPLLHIEQRVSVPSGVGPFHLSMDTSEDQPFGRIDGSKSQTSDISVDSRLDLIDALTDLPNVGRVDVSRVDEEDDLASHYVVTFRDVYGEYPLLSASDPSVAIARNNGRFSATEIQTVTLSSDKPFVYEVQSVSCANDTPSIELSFMSGPKTGSFFCNFANAEAAQAAVQLLEDELNSLPNLTARVDPLVSGDGNEGSPWRFEVTILEPVGPLPLLESDTASVSQVVQGESTLSGTVVMSYQGAYTSDIAFDASPKEIKYKLEELETINEVNVRRNDIYTGYQWAISFTGDAGNLPMLRVHDNRFEVQQILTLGGIPTPLGGMFSLRYNDEETSLVPHDSSADVLKSALEALPSIDHVDVALEELENGQCSWLVTFRLPERPALLTMNTASISGTLAAATVEVAVEAQSPSLLASAGSPPSMAVEEQVSGLPSYTAKYRAEEAGSYSLAVLQLERGGLSATYYDNQWLLEEAVVERIDPTVNFNWGAGLITQYGRDYVSARWWGKVRPETTEEYTFFLRADDGARLYLDHVLLIDAWESSSRTVEQRATVELAAGNFHDVKVEYREVTGDASIRLEWSSRSVGKQIVPSDQLFFPSHIVGSPFSTEISPGAADYPHSGFIDVDGQDRSATVAGQRTKFFLQARDSGGNDKLTPSSRMGVDSQQFTVEIIGDHGSVAGEVTYIDNGQYQVDYTVLKSGSYQVYVKTGGTDIYCGLGEEARCSPFELTVLPGRTFPPACEVESSHDPIDGIVEARVGDSTRLYLQTKDVFGNNRQTGGDDVRVSFRSTANPDVVYRGHVLDQNDGSYRLSYSIPLAGSYDVSITVAGERVQYCVGPTGDKRWDNRQFDGNNVYVSPSFCSLNDELSLTVIHRELHGASSSLVGDGSDSNGLSSAVVGVETGFVIEARDQFGNLRSGSGTTNIEMSGDGSDDVFFVSLVGPNNSVVETSTAVQILTSTDSSVQGEFRLFFGGDTSHDMPHDISGPAMQTVLSMMHGGLSVEVVRSTSASGYVWEITFLDHLDLWSKSPLAVRRGSNGLDSVSNTLTVTKRASAGMYPVRFTLWETGMYELSVFSDGALVSGGSYSLEAVNGGPRASSSTASGAGLMAGVAGETSTFEISIRDSRRSEVQAVVAAAEVIDFINEKQQIYIQTHSGGTFQLDFRGQRTSEIEVGVSTLDDLESALEALSSVGDVSITSDGTLDAIQTGDIVDVEFLTERGPLPLISTTGTDLVARTVHGEAPYRPERQSFECDASGGYVILTYRSELATLDFNDSLETAQAKLSAMFGRSVVVHSDHASYVCDSAPFIVDFPIAMGDVETPTISFDALENGSLSLFGNGEDNVGAVDGNTPIMGSFTLSFNGEETSPLDVGATASAVKEALENLDAVGLVSVEKDSFGPASIFSVWSITFASETSGGYNPHLGGPLNIGDLPELRVDSSMLTHVAGATQLQQVPEVKVVEVSKGSAGNLIGDLQGVEVGVSLTHVLAGDTGIGMYEVHVLTCAYSEDASNPAGSFELKMMDSSIQVEGQTALSDLKILIRDGLGTSRLISTAGSSHATVCHFDPSNPQTAMTKLKFNEEDGPLPPFEVGSIQGLMGVSVSNPIDSIDGLEYVGGGKILVSYTPRLSGHYAATIQVGNEDIWSDLSSGVTIHPAAPSALHTTHNSNVAAVSGTKQTFNLMARDRFENRIINTMPLDSLIVSIEGTSNDCSGDPNRQEIPRLDIEQLEIGSPDGHYTVSYTPTLAGLYRSNLKMRSQGGLLATYFRSQYFSQPMLRVDKTSNVPPYQDASWCPVNEDCDSTQLDSTISFDWGLGSPFPTSYEFPMDSFSVVWDGEVRAEQTDDYTFSVRCLNGGVRLTIGDYPLLIDNLPHANADILVSQPIELIENEYYTIKVEYMHSNDEALIELEWESPTLQRETVPPRVLFYARHVQNSPYLIQSSPGDIAVTSSAQGDGTSSCTALEECSFVVQTRDTNDNNRYNDGSDPGFEVTIVGTGGWAGEGRNNSVVATGDPIAVASEVTSNDWQYLGEADVTHLSMEVRTASSFAGIVKRGDRLVIDGMPYSVSSSGSFDSTSVPLASPFLGRSASNVPVFRSSKICNSDEDGTGTHAVTYTPSVMGTYEIDVKLPPKREVQRITSHTASHAPLTGSFVLSYEGAETNAIAFDANGEEMQLALGAIEAIESVEVLVTDCVDPAVTCTWTVTFPSLVDHDISLLEADTVALGGDSSGIDIVSVVKGQDSSSIRGFPRAVQVLPNVAFPAKTTAYGRGLVTATAGSVATFSIQPKDEYGNDVSTTGQSVPFAVFVYPEENGVDSPYPVTRGTVTRSDDGLYAVEYVPKLSGYHTVAVVQSIACAQQKVTSRFNTRARGGTFVLELGSLKSPPIAWDAPEETIKTLLESSMASVSSFDVQKVSHGLLNFQYFIRFETLLGEAPLFQVDASSLTGNSGDWTVESVVEGRFQHIKPGFLSTPEIQLVTIESGAANSSFFLSFKGQTTEPLPVSASASQIEQALETLSTVGDIDVEEDGLQVWKVTFKATTTFRSLTNYGNLPLLIATSHGDASVRVDTLEDGRSPFRVHVKPAESRAAKTTAYDYDGVASFEGLSTGVYKTESHFFVQARDEFANAVDDGPLREVQIVETISSSQIAGFFELTAMGRTARFDASASVAEVEKDLRSLGLGLVDVTSNSAKDLIVGKTVSVTKGLATITPSAALSEFIVGDWIRIEEDGRLFTISEMSQVPPYTITLSSPYLGSSDEMLNVYQHGTPLDRRGYQYILSFDAVLGDLQEIEVDGTLLEGDAEISVTSCNLNVSQLIVIQPSDERYQVEGHFYLIYGDYQTRTRLMDIEVTSEEMKTAIIEDIDQIHSIEIASGANGGTRSWSIELISFDGAPQLLFPEANHLLVNALATVENDCPVASSHDPLYTASSVAGRQGQNYFVAIDGQSLSMNGSIEHLENGRYSASYVTPRVDNYNLSVLEASPGGLTGHYYDNRLLATTPSQTRVDWSINFDWEQGHEIVSFTSVRWAGYVRPAFSERYKFIAEVNAGIRLKVGNNLLIDKYEAEVQNQSGYEVFTAETPGALESNQLVRIEIDHRKGATSGIRLFWKSSSQPLAIIDGTRLYSHANHIQGSPFEVTPRAILPDIPAACSLEVTSWDTLRVSWSPPEDDGGSYVTKYLVEHYDASAAPIVPLSEEVLVKNGQQSAYSLDIGGLEQSSDVADGFGVRVLASNSEGYGPPCIRFMKPSGPPLPPDVVELERVAGNPSAISLHFTSVTSPSDHGDPTTGYFVEWDVAPDFANATSADLDGGSFASERLPSYSNEGKQFNRFLIENLTPGQEYWVRIAAINGNGKGPSAPRASIVPGSKPSSDLGFDDGTATLSTITADASISVKESSSTLQVAWRAPYAANGFPITHFLVEHWMSGGVQEVEEITLLSSSDNPVHGTFTLRYGDAKTGSLSVDSSAETVKTALESLSTIRSAKVWRSGSNPDLTWTCTFLSEYPAVYGLRLEVHHSTELADPADSSNAPLLQINVVTPGSLPMGYHAETIRVEDAAQEQYSLVLRDLVPGQAYYCQVSSGNELGYGHPRATTPFSFAPPTQKSSKPLNIILSITSSDSIEVLFSGPESDGGDAITQYRIDWDASENFNGTDGSTPLGSYSFIAPLDEQGCAPCSHTISSLAQGVDYFVRVYAYNSHGYSNEPGLPSPPFLAPQTTPSPPIEVTLSPISDIEIQVNFSSTTNDGGSPVEKYKIEWRPMGYLPSFLGENGQDILYSRYNVQSLTISADEDDLDGGFRVMYGGHTSGRISAGATESDLKATLESLPTVGSTVVSRDTLANGVTWVVTFLSNYGDGAGGFGPGELLHVSIYSDSLSDDFVLDTASESISGSPMLHGTNARLIVREEVRAFDGYEQQVISAQCSTPSGILSGHYVISFDGVSSNELPFDASASDVETALEMNGSVGAAKVTRRKMSDRLNSFEWNVIFLDYLGNVPLLKVHNHLTCAGGTTLLYATERAQGVLPGMDGSQVGKTEIDAGNLDDYSITVGGLHHNIPYHFQVSAANSQGYGTSQFSTPSTMTPKSKPDRPFAVELASIDDTRLEVSWKTLSPQHELAQYRINLGEHEFDVFPLVEVQALILESSADDVSGSFRVHFNGEKTGPIGLISSSDALKDALHGLSTVDEVEVSESTLTSVYPYGRRWTITFISPRGNLPSLLVDTGSGKPSTVATGGTLSGSDAILRVENVHKGGLPSSFVTPPVLSSLNAYTAQVSSHNGHFWSDASSSINSLSPSKTNPSEPQDVTIHVLSPSQLLVSWADPLFDGGNDLRHYSIEWSDSEVWGDSEALVSVDPSESSHNYVIENLQNKSYYVRVFARTTHGFSSPVLATPLLFDD